MIGFAWDPKKAASNLFDHKVSFEQAAVAFRAPFAVEWVDDREEYDEERMSLLRLCGREVLYVAYTERGANVRIITARRAEKREQDGSYRQNAP
jgi:uncharacterized DUF497 family protein